MLKSSRSKSFALALAVALCSTALVFARQKSESRQKVESRPAADAGARGRVEALRSPDAQKRAAAAYEISKRAGEAKALVSTLVEMLGDAATVDAHAYRKHEQWTSEVPVTVGPEAARSDGGGMRGGRAFNRSTRAQRAGGAQERGLGARRNRRPARRHAPDRDAPARRG